MSILVIGGAGHIGSHKVWLLGQKGADDVTLDNPSRGHRDALLHDRFGVRSRRAGCRAHQDRLQQRELLPQGPAGWLSRPLDSLSPALASLVQDPRPGGYPRRASAVCPGECGGEGDIGEDVRVGSILQREFDVGSGGFFVGEGG
jgi:hypothetical protein